MVSIPSKLGGVNFRYIAERARYQVQYGASISYHEQIIVLVNVYTEAFVDTAELSALNIDNGAGFRSEHGIATIAATD